MEKFVKDYTTFVNESNQNFENERIANIQPSDSRVKDVKDIGFMSSRNFDKKNKLNRSANYKFDISFMDKLADDGLTYEDLLDLENKVDIFKYQTQITIHGIFPESQLSYIGGYKNVIINKNKSLGIKYNAIDYKKKMELAKLISNASKFRYHRSSSDNYYFLTTRDMQFATDEFNKINPDLFLGNKSLQSFNLLGVMYYYVVINIDAFPIENMDKIVENFTGKSKAEIEKEMEVKRIADELRWEKSREQSRLESEKKKQDIQNFIDTEMSKYTKVTLDENTPVGKVYLGIREEFGNKEFYAIKYMGKKGAYYSYNMEKVNDVDTFIEKKDDLFTSQLYLTKNSDKSLVDLLKRMNRIYTVFDI